MRIEHERAAHKKRWLLETTSVIDYAVASLLIAAGAAVMHLLGLEGAVVEFLKGVVS